MYYLFSLKIDYSIEPSYFNYMSIGIVTKCRIYVHLVVAQSSKQAVKIPGWKGMQAGGNEWLSFHQDLKSLWQECPPVGEYSSA